MSETTNVISAAPGRTTAPTTTNQPTDTLSSWFKALDTSPTTITHQPGSPLKPRNWSSGLCACTEDQKICCKGFWCLPCLACQVSQELGESFCLPCCVPCAYINVLRMKIRLEQNLVGSAMDDCCPVCCCPSCALCQLAREIKYVKRSQLTLSRYRRLDTSYT